ncbi:MAG: hypothetical protein MJZ93_00640 [Paludibacteraceae bacterium]|nr:hypothetical protein [Paludibacteraceae bacterium]
MKIRIAFLLTIVLTLFWSCSNDSVFSKSDAEGVVMEVTDVDFSDDYANFKVKTRLTSAASKYSPSMWDTVTFSVNETNHLGTSINRIFQPELLHIVRTGIREADSIGLRMLVMVDLTVPQAKVNYQRKCITEMLNMFSERNLFVSFFRGDDVTESMPLTDYILDTYFTSVEPENKFLYRAVLDKFAELQKRSGCLEGANYCSLIVFTDGGTYSEEQVPYDSNHFSLQSEILSSVHNLNGSPVYFVYVDNNESGVMNDAENLMRSVSEETNGKYMASFDWGAIQHDILESFELDYTDFEFYFKNADGKLYNGKYNLSVTMNEENSDGEIEEICLFKTDYMVGGLLDPVIINGDSITSIFFQGVLLGLLILIIVFVVLQFLYPFVKYQMFRKKYVVEYRGPNASAGENLVGDYCYFCKAPFKKGDSVVAACEHTMHEECWKENEYHCPEFGKKCKKGSYYYNEDNLFDRRNAPYFMHWIVLGIISAIIAWVSILTVNVENKIRLLQRLMCFISGYQYGTPEANEFLVQHLIYIIQYPITGFNIAFIITFVLSFYTIYRFSMLDRILSVFFRALSAGLLSYLFFMVECLLITAFDLRENALYINIIPWSLMGIISLYATTYGSRVKPKRMWELSTIVVGSVSVYLWDILFSSSSVDYRILFFVTILIYAIGLALSIASPIGIDDKAFLHVQGSMKEMDVALYKWFKNSPDAKVTIGRSVDCNFQITWDIGNDIAARVAMIERKKNVLVLTCLDGGVFYNNRYMKVGESVKLFHGREFQIGGTRFSIILK